MDLRVLSELRGFVKPKLFLEQYETDVNTLIKLVNSIKEIDGLDNSFLDLGAGTGFISIALELAGAKSITAVEMDFDACEIFKENMMRINSKKIKLLNQAISPILADITVMNPPWGAQARGLDSSFLDVSFKSSKIIYSIHNKNSELYLRDYASKKNFIITNVWDVSIPLRKYYLHHKKTIYYQDAIIIRLEYEKRKSDS